MFEPFCREIVEKKARKKVIKKNNNCDISWKAIKQKDKQQELNGKWKEI